MSVDRLRFIKRDGKRILQQLVPKGIDTADNKVSEWQDIPLEDGEEGDIVCATQKS